MKPQIVKLGTIDCDLAETTPVVFKGKLYRFEYVRADYWANPIRRPYFRFVEHDTGKPGKPFAHGYHLGNVMADNDRVYVTATNEWDGERVDIFASNDMEHWESWNALDLPGWGIFNTSLCMANGKYVLMFEVGKPPEVVGVRFTARFATSPDMKQWELTPPECAYARDRFTAPHCLRYLDGYYYNFYVEELPTNPAEGYRNSYEQHVVRSKDLVHWESSPYNPVLKASPEDRRLANPALPDVFRDRIANAVDINNSDIDLCEYEGKVIINYCWGSQVLPEHLAEAYYDGDLASFLTGWFPEE